MDVNLVSGCSRLRNGIDPSCVSNENEVDWLKAGFSGKGCDMQWRTLCPDEPSTLYIPLDTPKVIKSRRVE